jgi:hypothetical protein
MKTTVGMHNGTPTVFIDERPVFLSYLWMAGPTHDEYPNADTTRAYAQAGIDLHAFDVGTQAKEPEWCGPNPNSTGHWDFSTLGTRFGRILDANPDALFHLRIHMRMPPWWQRLYPDECEIPSPDRPGGSAAQSFASILWRQQANDFLRAYVDALRSQGLLDRVIAYQVGAGNTSEWVKGDLSMDQVCPDFSTPMQRHFRQWLGERYSHDASALRAAWADDSVDFATADVPSADEQLHTRDFTFRDPRQEMRVIDFYRCLAELCGDLVVDFCRTVKEATNGQALAGAFFGYLLELAWNKSFFAAGTESEYSCYQRSGHLGLRQLLRSEHVDFIVSPYSYGFRGIGGEGVAMPPQDSLRVHGKVFIFEEDTRTHLHTTDTYGRSYTPEAAEAVLNRNFAQVLTRGQGVWWHSEIDPSKDPGLQPVMERFQRLGTFGLSLNRTPAAEIAVILDDESFFYETVRNDLDLPLIFQQRLWGLPRLGAPFDTYLLEDLCEGRLPSYKMYIFLNAFRVDRGRREDLRRQVCRDGQVAVWIFAPGYIEDESSTEHMEELTGFRFGKGMHPWGPLMHVLDFTHPITRKLPQDLFWGTNSPVGPVFYLDDPEARILGQVVFSEGQCRPGLGVKEQDDWRSVYVAAPNIPAPVLRGLASYAGVHLYSEAGDVLYATPELLAVHTVAGGQRQFRLPRRVEVVYDLLHEQELHLDTDTVKVQLEPASTSLYYTGARDRLRSLGQG